MVQIFIKNMVKSVSLDLGRNLRSQERKRNVAEIVFNLL